ncbi:MAG TPA: 4'-phosphopantetheinyl transferase superfamily protein [Methylomirabilota bacterium]|nr:4'-phosphopantetheinyl transferase superfamily protein [Methylomirabilota bacterium]
MEWPAITQPPPLDEGDVHVWLADLSYRGDSLGRAAGILSEDERERATRFHFPHDAGRWMVSRAALRSILGRYLGVEAAAVRFCAGPWGKPQLTASFQGHLLEFNASRSDGLGLYAVARNRRVGVDIERVRPLPDLEAMAAHIFSPREQQALGQPPDAEPCAAFFSGWTRKEAYVKALGEGLAHTRERFAAELGRWSLSALAPAPGYAAAVAIEGPPARLLCAQWQERGAPTTSGCSSRSLT